VQVTIMMIGLAVQKFFEYSLISSLKIKLNSTWNFSEELECAFGVVLYVQDLMEFIWIQNVGDIDFKVNSATKSSNKFQKTRFWKEKSVEDMVTLPSTTQATVVLMMQKLEWLMLVDTFYFLPLMWGNVWSICIPSLVGLFMVWVHKWTS